MDLSGIYETQGGRFVEIKKSEHQFIAVFHRFGLLKRTLKLDDNRVQDVQARLKGTVLRSGDIQFENGCWWKKHAGPQLRFKYADCSTGWLSDLNPARWSSLMNPTGMLASITTTASDLHGPNFLRPLLVEEYESVLSRKADKVKIIADYDGLRELLVSPENRAFQWRRKGKAWSEWMSKAELSRDVQLQIPDFVKKPIEIRVFAGIPSQWGVQAVKNIGSAEAFKAALDTNPALNLSKTKTESASATVVAARLAEEIYKDPARIQADNVDFGHAFFGITEEHCSEGSCIFIVFRGTFNLMTAITDLKCDLSPDEPWSNKIGIHVHVGIWSDLRGAIQSGILSKLMNLWKSKKSKKLILTGHSLGAGLAMMLHAYIWILLNCEAKDSVGYCKEFEEPGFRNFLQSARCYAFAGPMVFAKSDSPGEGSWQNAFIAHMVQTATNFMFRDDFVPRAFSAVKIEDAIKKVGKQASKTYRKLALVARLLRYDAEKLASSAVSTLASSGDLSAFNRHAHKYSHCCMVEVIGRRSLPWHEIHVGVESFTHHSMKTYRISAECREQGEGFFKKYRVCLEKQESRSRPSSFHAMDPSQLWKKAKEGEWDTVLMALEAQSESLDGFLHLAAFQQKQHAIIGLCRLGADPLSRQDEKSIVESSESNAEAEHPKEFCNWLQMIVDVAQNLHSAGSPVEDVAKDIAKEWEESRGLPASATGDEFRQLKVKNLLDQGLTMAQIEMDENMHETFAEAMERIQKQLSEGQLEEQKLDMKDEEKVHEFLDLAKFFDYVQMHARLQEERSLSSRTVRGRWSASMQVVYNSIISGEYSMVDVIKLLGHYPSLATIELVQADLKKCIEQARTDVEAKEEEQAEQAGRRRRRVASALDGDKINEYERKLEILIKEIIKNPEKHPESNMQSLVNAANKSICKSECAGQIQQQDTL